MKKFYFTLLFALLFSFTNAQTNNAIEPELQNILEQKNDDLIDLNIYFRLTADHDQLQKKSKRISDKSTKREIIVNELKDFSEESQADVLSILKAEELNGNVSDINCLWITNMINCKASRDVVYRLSSHPDVKKLGYNKEHQLLSPDAMKEVENSQVGNLRGPAHHIVTVQADHVWEQGYTGKNVVVAVLDSGTNYAHADIKDNLWEGYVDTDGDGIEDELVNGWNYIAKNSDITDDFGHGSHCAGIVCGNGASGTTTGVAPDAKLMTIKTVGAAGSGSVAQMLSGVQFAVENGADILSMSLGFKNSQLSTAQKESIRDAFVNVLSSGVIVCAAAGNDGTSIGTPYNVDYPAACPPPYLHPDQTALQSGGLSSVVCVGGSDIIGTSSQGPSAWGDDTKYNDYPYDGTNTFGLIRPDISAPGNLIQSLNHLICNDYQLKTGTSQSTPCVAGVMALMLEKNSSLTPAQIAEIIETTAVDKPATKNNVVGSGRIDALAAVNAVEVGTAAPYVKLASVSPQVLTQGSAKSISVTVKNEGKGSSATNTTATISLNDDPYVTITSDTYALGQMSTSNSKTATFTIDIDAQTPNGHIAVFDLVITSNTYTWKDIFSVEITSTPDLAFKSVNPGIIGINEDKVITVTIANNGTADQNNATTLTLSALSNDLNYLTIVDNEATINSIPAGGSATAQFTIRANESAPHNYSADFFIEAVSESSTVSNYTYEFENGTDGWTSFDAANNGIKTPWWHCNDAILHGKSAKDSHSGSGHLMSETVEKGLVEYNNPIDNYLVAPSKIEVTANTEISFYARAYDEYYYYSEHFGLAISTTGNASEDDFTTVEEWIMTPAEGKSWNKYSYDLSAYAGQEVYVAIRHFFTQDEWNDAKKADKGHGVWALNIDDVVFSNVVFNTHHVPTYSYDDPYHFNVIIENSIELPAPENFTVTPNGTSTSEILLSWDAVDKAKSYNIYRDGKYLANLTETTYTDSGLTHNTEYCYKVVAIYNGVEGIFTDNVCVTTNQEKWNVILTGYSPETIYVGTNDSEMTVSLISDGAQNLPARGIISLTTDNDYVEITTGSVTKYPADMNAGVDITYAITVDSNIPNNSYIDFNVNIVDGANTDTEDYEFNLPFQVYVKNDPGTPTNVVVIEKDDISMTLGWDEVVGAICYNVYRDGVYVGNTSSTSFYDNGLERETEYCYAVTSINANGESEPSEEICRETDSEKLGIIVESFDMGVEIGQDIELNVTLVNKSGQATSDGTATLNISDGYVTIVDGVDDLPALEIDGTANVTFIINFDSNIPLNYILDFDVLAEYEGGGTGSGIKNLPYTFDNDLEGWTTIDANTDGHKWFHSSVQGEHGYNKTHTSPSGNGHLFSESFCNNNNSSVSPNDWLVSPKQITPTDATEIQFYACSKANQYKYAYEKFSVKVSTNSNSSSTVDYVTIETWEFDNTKTTTDLDMNVRSVSLSSYKDQKIWVAIHHHDCGDNAALAIDDITITNVNETSMISTTSSFTVTANQTLNTFKGTGLWSDKTRWSKKIVPSAGEDVVIDGDATIESGNITVNTLTIGTGSLTINSGVDFTVSSVIINKNADKLIINDGAQVFQSNSNIPATYVMLIDNPASWGNDRTGGWQFISSPVLNADISAFEPESETDYDLFKYDGTQELQWVNYKNHPMDFETTFQTGRGYIVSYEAETTAKFKGNLNNATTHTFSDAKSYDAEDEYSNVYLLGNPFTFNMDWSNISSISNIYNGYATISNIDGSYDYHTSGTIKVGDGFMVKTIGDSPVLTYGGRAHNEKYESINIIASNIHGSDNAIIHLEGQNDYGFSKLNSLNKNIAEVYIENEGKRYGIFSFDENIGEVTLGFDAKTPGLHIISIEPDGEFEYITLVDNLTGKETDMLKSNYEFSVYSSEEKHDRFTVKFRKKSIAENNSFVYQSGEELIINAEGFVQIFDVMGRIIYSNNVSCDNNRINISNINSATYVIRLINGNEVKTQKVIVQ